MYVVKSSFIQAIILQSFASLAGSFHIGVTSYICK